MPYAEVILIEQSVSKGKSKIFVSIMFQVQQFDGWRGIRQRRVDVQRCLNAQYLLFFAPSRRDKRQDHIISDFCSVVADRAGRQAEAEVQKTGGKKSIVRQSYNWHNELAAKAAASAAAAAAAAWQASRQRRNGRGIFVPYFKRQMQNH